MNSNRELLDQSQPKDPTATRPAPYALGQQPHDSQTVIGSPSVSELCIMADGQPERVVRYLKAAERMEATAAQISDPSVAAGYFALAVQWRRLAEDALRFERLVHGSGEGEVRTPAKGPPSSCA